MYFTTRVTLEFETDKGKPRKKTETYLVQAESVTDAETIIHEKFAGYKMPFEVTGCTKSRVIDVYSSDDGKVYESED